LVTLAAETRAVLWLILMYEAISLKKTILPPKVMLAVVLCLAANGVAAVDLDFPDNLTNPARLDATTTANWSEIDGTYSLVVGDQSLNDPQGHGVMTPIGGGSDNSAAAVMGDVNDDGELDLVVGNKGGINKVYLGDGDGGFALGPGDGGIGDEMDVSTSLALGDVDGDGDLDLFVGNSGLAESDDLSNKLYLNDGSGNFSLKQPFIDSPSPDLDDTRALVLGDVDGDGDLDLLAANAGQANKLYLNDGDANFAVVGVAIGSEIDTSTSLVLLDVNDDDALDLIVGNADEITAAGKINRLYLNDGSGGFSRSQQSLGNDDKDATYALAFGDVDNDGDVDLVAANKNQVNKLYLNKGQGKFDVSGTAIGDEIDDSSSVMLVDMDSDGDLDLVVGNENQTNKLYLNEGFGQFPSIGTVLGDEADTSKAVCLGDVDGDGDMDLLVVNQGQDHKLFRNGRGGGFVGLGADFAGSQGSLVNSIAVGDLNNDGFEDVVVGLYGEGNRVYLNDGSGGFFAGGVEIGVDADADATYDIVLADLNGDEFLDIVVGNYGEVNKVYFNDADGSGHFSTAGEVIGADDEAAIFSTSIPPAYSATYSIALADVDADDDLDLVVGNNYQLNKLYLNDGGVFPSVGQDIGIDTDATYSVAFTDIDGDNAPDLITANSGQTNKFYLNDGAGGFAAGTDIGDQLNLETDGSVSLAVADVDGVNGPDIVFGNDVNQANKLYLNDGSGGFTSVGISIGSVADYSGDLDLADADGDGDIDLLVANKNQLNKLYLNDGVGGFSTAMTVGEEVADSRFIKLVNFDEDDSPEVLVGNYGQASKHYSQVVYRGHVGRVVSKQVNPVGLSVRTASVAANMNVNNVGSRNTSVDFYLSNNGGSKWYRVNVGKEFFFPAFGDDLRWKVELKSRSPVRTPVLDDVVVSRLNTLPAFTATPSIKGVFAVGETLALINYAAIDPEDENGEVIYSFQWLSNDDDIDGAVADTYVLTEADFDTEITVKVSAKDSEDGEVTVVTQPVSELFFDELGVGENSDPREDDAVDESAGGEEEASSVVKRRGGGGLNLLSLLGLMLLCMWRLLAGRWSKRVVVPVFIGHF